MSIIVEFSSDEENDEENNDKKEEKVNLFRYREIKHIQYYNIRMKPSQLHSKYLEHIKEKIEHKYSNKIIPNVGIVKNINMIDLIDQDNNGIIDVDGFIRMKFKMTMNVISLPKENDVYEGSVLSAFNSTYFIYPSIFSTNEKLPLEILLFNMKMESPDQNSNTESDQFYSRYSKSSFSLIRDKKMKNENINVNHRKLKVDDKILVKVYKCIYTNTQYNSVVHEAQNQLTKV